MAIVPTTLEEWRSMESRAITSRETFLNTRRNERAYLLSGGLLFGGASFSGLNARGSGHTRIQLEVHYPDGTVSGMYELPLRSVSTSSAANAGEKRLEQILSQHVGLVVEGTVGGFYRNHNFHVHYIRTPAVEAVVTSGRVLQISLNHGIEHS